MSRMSFTTTASQGLVNSQGNFLANGSNVFIATTMGVSFATTPSLIVMELYKGTIDNFSTFTNVSSRASDKLVTFECGSTPYTQQSITGGFQYRLGASLSTSAIAVGTGTATWFLLRRNDGTGSLSTMGAMMGTVGLVGSGSDIEMSDNSVVTGNPYRSNGFLLSFYNDWVV